MSKRPANAKPLGNTQLRGKTAREINLTGAQHVECAVTHFVSDRKHKIVTTPAYMEKALPHEVFQGIHLLAKELIEMA